MKAESGPQLWSSSVETSVPTGITGWELQLEEVGVVGWRFLGCWNGGVRDVRFTALLPCAVSNFLCDAKCLLTLNEDRRATLPYGKWWLHIRLWSWRSSSLNSTALSHCCLLLDLMESGALTHSSPFAWCVHRQFKYLTSSVHTCNMNIHNRICWPRMFTSTPTALLALSTANAYTLSCHIQFWHPSAGQNKSSFFPLGLT